MTSLVSMKNQAQAAFLNERKLFFDVVIKLCVSPSMANGGLISVRHRRTEIATTALEEACIFLWYNVNQELRVI